MEDKFAEWMAEFMKTPEWENDSFHWDDMAKSAFQFGLQTAAEHLMKPQPSTTAFCCLSTLSKASDEIRNLAE